MPAVLTARLHSAPWWWWLLTAALAGLWLLAWVDREAIGAIEDWWQYALTHGPRRDAPWPLQMNHWTHALAGAGAVLWLAWLLGRQRWWLALAVVAAVAAVDESLQTYDPHRKARIGDVAASLAGGGLAALAIRRRRQAGEGEG